MKQFQLVDGSLGFAAIHSFHLVEGNHFVVLARILTRLQDQFVEPNETWDENQLSSINGANFRVFPLRLILLIYFFLITIFFCFFFHFFDFFLFFIFSNSLI
jgi:hypothetical protein